MARRKVKPDGANADLNRLITDAYVNLDPRRGRRFGHRTLPIGPEAEHLDDPAAAIVEAAARLLGPIDTRGRLVEPPSAADQYPADLASDSEIRDSYDAWLETVRGVIHREAAEVNSRHDKVRGR